MGKYREIGAGFEFAVYQKDVGGTLDSMQGMLESIEDLYGFTKSDLYRHMTFNSPKESFLVELRAKLIENFKDTNTYGYLKQNQRWKDIIEMA